MRPAASLAVQWRDPYPYTALPYATEISFGRLDHDADGTGELVLTRIEEARRGVSSAARSTNRAFCVGKAIRSAGTWAQPEAWGTWACYSGGEIALDLGPNDDLFYCVFLRLRASGQVFEQPVTLSANGEKIWQGSIGGHSRNIALRIPRRAAATGGWRLRIEARLALTSELTARIAAIDARVPTIGFERLIVVPEDDLKTRLDILSRLLL